MFEALLRPPGSPSHPRPTLAVSLAGDPPVFPMLRVHVSGRERERERTRARISRRTRTSATSRLLRGVAPRG